MSGGYHGLGRPWANCQAMAPTTRKYMPNPAARTAGRIRFAISTPPDEEPDIFHSPLLTFDTIVPAFQRYIRATTLSRPQRKARVPHPGRARFEGSRMGFPTRSWRYALRELLLLVIAATASFVFIITRISILITPSNSPTRTSNPTSSQR